MKNAYADKKTISKMLTFFMIVLTVSFVLVPLSLVSAQDVGASLTGTITDEGVDLDDDGYYDVLRVGFEINVTAAGTYTVDGGGLYDASYNSIYVEAKASDYLEEGVYYIYIDLDGRAIYAEAVSPTTLASVYLYDGSDTKISEIYDTALVNTYAYTEFQEPIIETELAEVDREIVLDQSGTLMVTTVYTVNNLGYLSGTLNLGIPKDASNLKIRDALGTLETSIDDTNLTVTLRNTIDTNETITLHLSYNLPWSDYVNNANGNDYALSSTFFEEFNSTVATLTVSVTLPEGATYQSSTSTPDSVETTKNKQTLTFAFSDVNPSDNLTFTVNYEYSVFWASFYPTIWLGILAVIGTAVYFFRSTTTKTVAAPTVQLPSKDLTTFVNTYDEKTTIKSELTSLEEMLQKGKIPRRKYKVRKKMLEGRLSSVSRSLSSLGSTIRAAGSNYASLLNQLEVAETKLENVEKDLQRIKSRYRRGEISKGAYGKLLEEYQSRIDDAESTIDGVLLRLRD